MRGVPVGEIINVALIGSGNDKIVPADRHVDDSVFEVEELAHFGQDISYDDPVLIIEVGLPVAVIELPVDNLSENDISATA